MLTFKEYCAESIGTMFIRSGLRALKHAVTNNEPKPNHSTPSVQAAIDKHLKRGNYHQAQTMNASLPAKDRRGPSSNPWAEKGPNKSSVPGVYQKTHEPKFPTIKPDPNTINLSGKLHPEPKKHQFHN